MNRTLLIGASGAACLLAAGIAYRGLRPPGQAAPPVRLEPPKPALVGAAKHLGREVRPSEEGQPASVYHPGISPENGPRPAYRTGSPDPDAPEDSVSEDAGPGAAMSAASRPGPRPGMPMPSNARGEGAWSGASSAGRFAGGRGSGPAHWGEGAAAPRRSGDGRAPAVPGRGGGSLAAPPSGGDRRTVVAGPGEGEAGLSEGEAPARSAARQEGAAPASSGDGGRGSLGARGGELPKVEGAPVKGMGKGSGSAASAEDAGTEAGFLSSLSSVRSSVQGGKGASPGSVSVPEAGSSGRPVRDLPGGSPGGQARGEGRQIALAQPSSGEPQMKGAVQGEKRFAKDRGGDAVVSVERLPDAQGGGPIAFTADMDIDADGAGGWYKGDHTGQSETSLRYPDGGSLNPGTLPFIVVPLDFKNHYPDVKLGDYAAVSYNGKTVFAIIGDNGPRGVVGEGSISLAASLGINPDPNKGGTGSGVRYLIFPGSRDGEPPRTAEQIQEKGRLLLDRQGIPMAAGGEAPR